MLEQAARKSSALSEPTRTKVRNIVRRLGQERIDQLVVDYEQGRTTVELMESYGLSKTSVIHLLQARGTALRRQPLTEEELERAAQLYKGGASLVAIEKRLSLPRETIRRGLLDVGVTLRPRGGSSSRNPRVSTSP